MNSERVWMDIACLIFLALKFFWINYD